MTTTTSRIAPGEESDIHDEPHLEGHRITVQFIHAQVADRGFDPETVAGEFDLDIADVYRALTYYSDHPEKLREVERNREQAIQDPEHFTTDPDSIRGWRGFRIVADEHVERPTRRYLRKEDRDVEWIGGAPIFFVEKSGRGRRNVSDR